MPPFTGFFSTVIGPIHQTVQEILPAHEAVWSDNAEGLPQADVVIIRAGESLNRRFYPKEAIQEAVTSGFWNDTPMFINHGDRAMPRKRQVQDLAARIDSTYLGAEGEARGKVTFINPEFAKFVRAAGKHVGLSAVHEFMGQRYRGTDGHYHERVNKFVANHSVDFVAFPAAGGGIAQFLPAQESEDNVEWNDLTPEMLKEHRPDLVAVLAAAESDGGGGDDDGKNEAPVPAPVPQPTPEPPAGFIKMETVRSIVQEEVTKVHDSYQERDRKMAKARTEVSAHIAKSGLPEKTKSRLLSAFESAEEYKAEAVQESIDSAAAELKETGWKGPKVSGLGDSAAQLPDEPAPSKTTYAAFEEQVAYVPRTGRVAADAGKAN